MEPLLYRGLIRSSSCSVVLVNRHCMQNICFDMLYIVLNGCRSCRWLSTRAVSPSLCRETIFRPSSHAQLLCPAHRNASRGLSINVSPYLIILHKALARTGVRPLLNDGRTQGMAISPWGLWWFTMGSEHKSLTIGSGTPNSEACPPEIEVGMLYFYSWALVSMYIRFHDLEVRPVANLFESSRKVAGKPCMTCW